MEGELFVLVDGKAFLCRNETGLFISASDKSNIIFYKRYENAKKMHKDRDYLEQYDIDPAALMIKKVEIDIVFKGNIYARYKV